MASIWLPKAQTSVGMPWEQENQCVLKGPGTKDSLTEELDSFKNTRLIRGHLPSSRVEGWLHPSGSLRPWFPWTFLKMPVREVIYSHLGFEVVSESLLLHALSCRESQVPIKRGQNHYQPSTGVGVSGCERAVAAFGSSIVSMTVAQRTRCPAPHREPAVRA